MATKLQRPTDKCLLLMGSCLYDAFYDDTAKTTVAVLEYLGVTLTPFGQSEQCCGFGGTFSVTFPHLSGRLGTLKPDPILDSGDSSCLMHLSGLARTQGRPIEQIALLL